MSLDDSSSLNTQDSAKTYLTWVGIGLSVNGLTILCDVSGSKFFLGFALTAIGVAFFFAGVRWQKIRTALPLRWRPFFANYASKRSLQSIAILSIVLPLLFQLAYSARELYFSKTVKQSNIPATPNTLLPDAVYQNEMGLQQTLDLADEMSQMFKGNTKYLISITAPNDNTKFQFDFRVFLNRVCDEHCRFAEPPNSEIDLDQRLSEPKFPGITIHEEYDSPSLRKFGPE
jgi:hypothetical protein